MHRIRSTEELLRRDKDMIADTPGLANGGIALAVVEPESVGWPEIARLLDEYGFIAFAGADKERLITEIRARFGDEGDLPYWDAFTANAPEALPICEKIIESSDKALIFQSSRVPNADEIDDVIRLNREVGVSPLPAWYMRGEGPPSLTGWIRSADGRMIACANGSMRYHPDGRMAGTFYVGSVSVARSERGIGLGTLVTALLVRDGVRLFGARSVIGVAQPANAPSRAMLMKCGLVNDPSRATVIYNRSGAFHTR